MFKGHHRMYVCMYCPFVTSGPRIVGTLDTTTAVQEFNISLAYVCQLLPKPIHYI